MSRKVSLVENKTIGEINLTPLMDLTFILLITFIITFPLLEQGVAVELPKAGGDPLEDQETISLSIDKNGVWYIDEREVPESAFAAEVGQLMASRPNDVYLIRGDESVPYGELIRMMGVLKKQGIEKVNLVTQAAGE